MLNQKVDGCVCTLVKGVQIATTSATEYKKFYSWIWLLKKVGGIKLEDAVIG
jgi:hypothetical protein